MRARRPSLATAGALACAALSLWASFGALAFVEADNRAAYVGLLPSLRSLALLLAVAAAAAVGMRPSPRIVAPLWLSAVILLPWLPLPLPLSVFIWTGHGLIWLWTAIAVALLVPLSGRVLGSSMPHPSPAACATTAGVLALTMYGLGAWAVAPAHPNGDEPHYLIITQSILRDHDLKIENNHRQGDYQIYLDRAIPPDFLKRGKDGQIYSIHAPGLPLLIAPFFSLSGYPGVIAGLAMMSAFGSALVWLFAWRATGHSGAAWFAWAAVALSAPFFFHSVSVFPEAVAAVLLLLALLPLVDSGVVGSRSLLCSGATLAMLPWLHSRFTILAVSAALVLSGRIVSSSAERGRHFAALIAFPFVSAAAWFLFFQIIYGTPNPSVVYGGNTNTAIGNIVRGAPGLLFDQQFGLMSNAPVYLCALAGLISMLRQGRRRLAIELGVIVLPYFLVVGFFFMWWAGTTPPARFLVSIALLASAPIAIWFAGATIVARAAGFLALMVSVLITATMALVDRGAFVFNFRDGMSRVGLWLTPVVDLTRAMPSLFQNDPATVLLQTTVWLGAIGLAIVAAAVLERHFRVPTVLALGLPLQVLTMAAVSSVWQTNDATAPRPYAAGSALLRRYDVDGGQIAIAYRPYRPLRHSDLLGAIVLARTLLGGAGQESASMSHLPPGTYEARGSTIGSASGRVLIRTDRVSGPIAAWDAASFGSTWTRQFTLPVGIAELQIDIEPAARPAIRDVSIRAASLAVPAEGLEGREARRGARYGPAVVFLLAGSAWVEPTGTWVAGSSEVEFVIAPDPETSPQLFVRNGPAGNDVTLESGEWRERLTLAPGEERFLRVPMAANGRLTALKVTAARGFRPADVDPKSQDQRYLGVWIETR